MTDRTDRPEDRVAAWLASQLPWIGAAPGETSPGDTALDDPTARMQPESVVASMAWITRKIHSLDRGQCPIVVSVDDLVERAQHRVAAHEVDSATFAPPYRRYSAQRLVELLVEHRASLIERDEDTTVTHGALRPESVFVRDGRVTAVGAGHLTGVGDRYRDLAITCAGLAEVIGPGAVAAFLAECGLERPDPVKLDFFVLLSQFG